jgi:hypothetical protein
MPPIGTSRHFAATQYPGRFRGEADMTNPGWRPPPKDAQRDATHVRAGSYSSPTAGQRGAPMRLLGRHHRGGGASAASLSLADRSKTGSHCVAGSIVFWVGERVGEQTATLRNPDK